MKKIIASLLIGSAAVFSGTVPIVPVGQDQFVSAVNQTTFDAPFAVGTYFQDETGNFYSHVADTGDIKTDYKGSSFKPASGTLIHITGYTQVATYLSPTSGATTSLALTSTQYAAIGAKDGLQAVPVVQDTTTLVGAITKKAHAAIGFDTAKDCGIVNPGTSITCATTTVSQTNGLIVWGQYKNSNSDDTPTGASAPTYNGVIGTFYDKGGVNASFGSFWGASTTVASANLVCKWSASSYHSCVASAYTGSTQASTSEAEAKNSNAGTATALGTVTVATANSWVIMYSITESTACCTVGAGGVMQLRVKHSGDFSNIIDSNQATSTGATSLSFSQTGNVWGTFIGSFPPAAAAASTPPVNDDSQWFNVI